MYLLNPYQYLCCEIPDGFIIFWFIVVAATYVLRFTQQLIFCRYEDASVEISDIHAVNLTAIVGDKGGSTRESFLSCKDASSGINILSTTFKPSAAGKIYPN